MSFTMVQEPLSKAGSISIKPYVNQSVDNMGLQNYGLALFEGVFHEEQLACIEHNGIKRYVTGLNEFAPEIKLIQNVEIREAKVREIRNIISELEKQLAANVINPDDPEFWNKVKLLRPDNDEFWAKITIRCGNTPVTLDPNKDPYDLIKIYAINAGGFSIIAKSYEDAKAKPRPPKFYLDKFEETASTKTETKKLRNKALAELQKMFDKNLNKLFYVAKIIDPAGATYKKTTSFDVIYDMMDKHINGEGAERNASRAAQEFLDTSNLEMESLKMKAIVKDAIYYRLLNAKSDGFIYHKTSGSMLGHNVQEVTEYLKNPLNDNILMEITKGVEKYWNN
jgi:hypothetical protein